MKTRLTLIRAMTLATALCTGLLVAGAQIPAREDERGIREHGYEHGYRDGYEYGRDTRARNVALDYRTDAYRDADHGYTPSFGSREEYSEGYREGYRNGAQDGYDGVRTGLERTYARPDDERYSERGRHSDYRDIASDIGYRDGVNAGMKDFRERHSYRPEKLDAWKDADHGYTSALGPKDEYKRAYRAAFETGYRDGFGIRGR